MIPQNELKIDAEIAQGGYGTIYTGTVVPKIQRGRLEAGKQYRVAVKDMKGDRRVRLNELLKEGRIMASLGSHPNVCQFVGIAFQGSGVMPSTNGKQYILSELMDCSLFDLLHGSENTRSPTNFRDALELFEQISAGVCYLHSRNLVHADLKSSNVLINASGSQSSSSSKPSLLPKICDFGHVAVRAHPAPHRQCGTPHWAAPEALRSEAVSPASDVFSIGVMLWEALALRVPHFELSFAQVIGGVGWGKWVPDESLLPEAVPEEVLELLRQCQSFSPSQRPAAREVQRRLKRTSKHARRTAAHLLVGFFLNS
jgi:serine/threonine protein kinase